MSQGLQGLVDFVTDLDVDGLIAGAIAELKESLLGPEALIPPPGEASELGLVQEEINKLSIKVLAPEFHTLTIKVRSPEEEQAFRDANPDLQTDAFRTGALGNIEEILAATLPQSIPITLNTRIVNPVTVLIDGRQVAQAVEERSYQDLQSATRRAGALGYVME